jgi:5'-deoxynucleotidase YfbR-like HD superfamily hydrolase
MTQNWKEVVETASGDVRRLSHVVRFSSIPVSVPENVAEHSFYVALYAIIIHKTLRPNDVDIVGAIILGAILHDLAEAKTGDVVRTFKYSSDALKKEIDKAEHVIISQFPALILDIYNLHKHIESDDHAYVSSVIKAADFMSLHQYMVREIRRGNQEIYPFFLRMEADLESMAAIQNDLSSLYEELLRTARKARNYITVMKCNP